MSRQHEQLEGVRFVHSRLEGDANRGICVAYYIKDGECSFSTYVQRDVLATYDKKRARAIAQGRLEVGKKSEFNIRKGVKFITQLCDAVTQFFHHRYHRDCTHAPIRFTAGTIPAQRQRQSGAFSVSSIEELEDFRGEVPDEVLDTARQIIQGIIDERDDGEEAKNATRH